MGPVPQEQFVEGMRHAAAAVAVVTSGDSHGSGLAGSTVSAMCSVSAEPPTLLICVNRSGSLAKSITQYRVFCVNLLAADQTDIADCFAGRIPEFNRSRFRCGQWTTLITGCPALEGAQAVFDCQVSAEQTVGTHVIIVGTVAGVRTTPTQPLIYLNRAYRNLAPTQAVDAQ